MGSMKKVQNHEYRVPEESMQAGDRWTWKSAKGVTKIEIDYILTNWPKILTDVTVINQVNIGSDHRLVMSNIKLDVEVESKNDDLEATKSRCHRRSKKIEFQLELRNRFETLQELDDIETISETITDMIQQSASTAIFKSLF